MGTRSKFILTYVGGIVTGIVLMILLGIFANMRNGATNKISDDIVMFDQPRPALDAKEFKVFQVLPDGSALAGADFTMDNDYGGTVVLFLNDNKEAYYDDQRITVPEGKILKQIGTFKYETKQEIVKTVPVVRLFNR